MTTVATRSAAFAARETEWALTRAFMVGASAVKTAQYIPPLSRDWGPDMHGPYVAGAYLFNAFEISADGFAGMITVKPPAVTVPDAMHEVAEDITGQGHDVEGLAAICADELMIVGCVGLLVDYPAAPVGLTQAQALAGGVRPMAVVYPVESILEVRTARLGGKSIIDRVRLAESVTVPSGEWGQAVKSRVRVLELDEVGLYQQRVYEQDKRGTWVQVEAIAPLANGQRLAFIPFTLAASNGAAFEPPRPPLHTLADANLAHLQDSALHQHGLRFCAQPVRFFAGVSAPAGAVPMLGSSIAVFADDPNAKASIVEASPAIVGAIVAAMEAKRRDMAVLGARFLAGDASAQIAENTARLNRAGDTASLSKITDAIESALVQCLKWCALFMGADETQISVQMSRDYMPVRMSANDLTALVMAWQSGAITQADLYANLVRGEIVSERQGGVEDYREELEGEAPVLALPA